MKIVILGLFIFCISIMTMKADLPSYELYTAKGKKAKFSDLVKDAVKSDIVFFGELHNVSLCHWLQLELCLAIFDKKGKDLVIGAEMFESDDQLKIDEYLSGLTNQRNFEAEAKLWNNYKTDYKPIFEFARENELNFIATNIPRRYAAIVARENFNALEKLSDDAKRLIPPLPILADMSLPGYESMKGMGGGHGMDYIAESQASKDATMAHFILKNLKKGNVFVHLNGTYHSNNYEGIVWFVRQQDSKLKIVTIATVEQEKISELSDENKELADYILVIPKNMFRTY